MTGTFLAMTVKAVNNRQWDMAVQHSAEGLAVSQGKDEVFWMGLNEACEGYRLINRGEMAPAEGKLVASMQKLRNFGFRHNNFEVTAALAGIRRAVEEIKAVRTRNKKVFDVSLLPQFKLAAKADD